MSEREEALKLAERILDRPNADPDDDLAMLSRQLLRTREWLDKVKADLEARIDPTIDLIHANRDTMLRIAEEGLRRVKKVLERIARSEHSDELSVADANIGLRILHAANTFHPMHGESWCGWPEGAS